MILSVLFFAAVQCRRFLAPDEDLDNDPQCFGAIFDAGSSGTRVYIYQWNCREQQVLPMVNVTESKNNRKVTPGLSAFGNNLTGIQPYLQPLIDFIYTVVPQNVYNYTPIMLGATAGMRILPQEEQNDIIRTVQQIFNSTKLLSNPEWARVISGQEEGMYMWMSTYYLLQQKVKPLLTIDLGGASTQIAFPYNGTSPDFVMLNVNLPPNVTNYSLYSVSYLGYGNDMARNGVLRLSIKQGSKQIISPCYFVGYKEFWDQDSSYQIIGDGNLTNCMGLIKQYLNTDDTHSIGGSYEPPVSNQQVYAANGVTTIASFFGLPSFTEASYYNKMQAFTSLTWEAAQIQYPNQTYLSTNYFMSIYTYELIKDGYNIPNTTTIYAPTTINGVTPSWTLAACSYQLAQINCTDDSPVCSFNSHESILLAIPMLFLMVLTN